MTPGYCRTDIDRPPVKSIGDEECLAQLGCLRGLRIVSCRVLEGTRPSRPHGVGMFLHVECSSSVKRLCRGYTWVTTASTFPGGVRMAQDL